MCLCVCVFMTIFCCRFVVSFLRSSSTFPCPPTSFCFVIIYIVEEEASALTVDFTTCCLSNCRRLKFCTHTHTHTTTTTAAVSLTQSPTHSLSACHPVSVFFHKSKRLAVSAVNESFTFSNFSEEAGKERRGLAKGPRRAGLPL